MSKKDCCEKNKDIISNKTKDYYEKTKMYC